MIRTALSFIAVGLLASGCAAAVDSEDGNDLEVATSEDAIRAAQGRLGKPEDIARAALYLASDDAEFVNGAQLFVDNCFSAV